MINYGKMFSNCDQSTFVSQYGENPEENLELKRDISEINILQNLIKKSALNERALHNMKSQVIF